MAAGDGSPELCKLRRSCSLDAAHGKGGRLPAHQGCTIKQCKLVLIDNKQETSCC